MSDKKILKYLLFYCIFGTVIFMFTLKAIFLMARYGITSNGRVCEQNDTLENATSTGPNHEYIFTVLVYAVLNLLRLLEYILLAKQFYFFVFEQEEINVSQFFAKHSKRYWYVVVFSVILLPYFALGLTIPSVGIYQELELTKQRAECSDNRHYHEIYVTYCFVNYFRYLSAYGVRFMMIYTTLALSKYWFPDHKGPPLHTSIGWFKPSNAPESSEINKSEQNEIQEPLDEHTDPPMLREVLQDWKVVSKDYQEHAQQYSSIGKQVQVIQDLFQTWFIVPWTIYFINSSLKTYNVLRPWNADGDGDTPLMDIPQIYYLLYNLNQFITLLIPFLCARKINTYHQKYYKIMRDYQLKSFEGNPSCLSFARQLMIEKEENYDFLPRIVGTSITINVGSPLYVIILLAGLFFSVTESIL